MITKPTITPATIRQQENTALAWQGEVTALRENYLLIELILRESGHLSTTTLAQYRNLQQLLLKTMEQFLDEMDRVDDTSARQRAAAQQMLKKHTATMRQLNRYADSMIRAYQA